MANRNTAIRGIQIRDNDITLTQLATSIGTSLGLADSAYQLPVGGIPANDLATAVQTSLGKADTALQAMGAFTSLTDVPSAYTSGDALKGVRVKATYDGLEFYTISDSVGILETAIAIEDLSALADDSKVEFTMATLAVVNSVQVYLNGLLQEEGSGKDYGYSEAGGKSVVTFVQAPETGDIVVIRSITRV